MDIYCHRHISFCIIRHLPSDEDFILSQTLLIKSSFLLLLEQNIVYLFKDNFQQSSNACAAYSNVITSRNLLPITGVSIKDGVSLI